MRYVCEALAAFYASNALNASITKPLKSVYKLVCQLSGFYRIIKKL